MMATPSASPTMMSPAETTTPPMATGSPMMPGPFLNGPAGVVAAGEDGQALLGQGVRVSDGSVHDGADNALGDHDLADEVTDESPGEVALSVDDQHVTGLGVVQGPVDGQVVAGPGEDRAGRCRRAGSGW